jgi:hypothetical protein
MDNEARKIARHHLGDTLTTAIRGGPHAADWIVFACHGTTEASARAPTADKAASACAAQLRAAGWSPSHARMEWTREFDDFSLVFHYDALPVKLWSGKLYSNGTGWAFNDSSGSLYNGSPLPKAEIVRIIAEWCAAHLPSLHLPLFPENPTSPPCAG